MKIQFAENGVQKEDTIPYVMQVPNDDAFVAVTFFGEEGTRARPGRKTASNQYVSKRTIGRG